MLIHTNGQSIPDEPKIDVVMQIIDNGPGQLNNINDAPNHFNGSIGIEQRGSTSNFFSDKKPYSIEIRDASGGDMDFPLLGMPAESDWALLAPFNDKTLIREALIFQLSREIMPWAPRTRFVELFLNGHYEGVYMVTEKIKRDKNRVDIAKLEATDLGGDPLTGGYILKLDKTTGTPNEGWTSPFPTQPGGWQTTLWQVEYPKLGDLQPVQKDYIQQWITGFESVMSGPNFAHPDNGYTKYVDVPSFLDFTLINEMAKCVDAYRISTFLYKDKDSNDPYLHAGPVWDFNIALGNAGYCTAENPEGWIIDFNQFCPGDNWVVPYWWPRMWEDPLYRTQLKQRWATLRAGPLSDANIFGKLDSLTQLLNDAQVRNFERWPVLYTWQWPNVYCCGSYEEHVAFMRNWLKARLEWMDANAKTLVTFETPGSLTETEVFPNPSADFIYFTLPEYSYGQADLRIFDLNGRLMEQVQMVSNTSLFTYDARRLPTGLFGFQIIQEGRVVKSGKISRIP
jgi:hypothetical protein